MLERTDIIQEIQKVYDYFCSDKIFSKLIPEVRSNISGSIETAKAPDDVAGIDGRITIINGFPKACGEIKFGASNHTARLLITAKEHDASINLVMNLKYLPDLLQRLVNSSSLDLFEFKRESQPKDVEQQENSTMQWLIRESIQKVGKVPDIIWDKGSNGKEPMMRIFAKNSKDLIKKLKIIIQFLD